MTTTSTPINTNRARSAKVGPWKAFLSATEIDPRLIGMLGALALIWVGFHVASGGLFLTPRNLWNLSVQTSSIAVMATGMVFVIVSRNIDLSIGSMLGFIGMVMGVMQARFLPGIIGFDNPATWIIALACGIVLGVAIGALQGYISAFQEVPSFIVTLGGLLIWRSAAWLVTSGQTVAPMDKTFALMGGGQLASIGATASWIVGAILCVAIIASLIHGRRQRLRFNFPQRPLWAEYFLGVIGCVAVLGGVAIVNAYPLPVGIARTYAKTHNIPWPDEGLFIPQGIAIPVLMALGAALLMTFIATRTRFGRYVFAIGGNPEAAELGGINTRWVTMKIFMVMGGLAAVSAAILTARQNAATNADGTLNELYTIAAAVIGGTSLSGGAGTVSGAMLGALIMQSLQSGMGLMDVDTPYQNIVVGVVLVAAVWADIVYRRHTA